MLCLSIAGISIGLDSDIPLRITEAFVPFQDDTAPDYIARFRRTDNPEFDSPGVIFSGVCFTVSDEKPPRRFYYSGPPGSSVPYAVSKTDFENRLISVSYTEDGLSHVNETGNSFFHLGWEELLLRERRLILHACAVSTKLGALLFCGVSGIGKSTQGQLWINEEEASPINGDRPIVYQKEEMGWVACGSPYAGSSRWYSNSEAPIRAIVLLEQSHENRVRPLRPAEAFRRLYSLMVVCDWNRELTARVCDLTEMLVAELPVYELACTPDRGAVTALKEVLCP